jgi:hypothetical protein
MEKLNVFVAHSFDKNDILITNWFISLMKKSPLNFNVTTGAKAIPERIDEKIKTEIADSSCVIGIFTKRYYIEDFKKWFPPPFIICECACAMGFYYNTSKIICGFYEEGIDPRDLALITIGGLELASFNREKLDRDKNKFIEYLKKIPSLVTSGSYKNGQIELYKLPYMQQYLRKIYTIYRNGNMTVQNINKILITDAERLEKENKKQIRHEIWHERHDIPSFKEMIETPISERKNKAFLDGILRYLNQKKINTKLSFTCERAEGRRIFFHVNFTDPNEKPLRFKNQDIIKYQYAWGFPKAYAPYEEDLPSLHSGEGIDEKCYDQAGIISAHGQIQEMILELRFERGRGPIFSKSPFFQHTHLVSHSPVWSQPTDMPLVEEEDHAMWFQTYKITRNNFLGMVRVLWRPSSKKYL